MTVRVAVIGAGRRGTAHTEAVADLEGVAQVVGVAERLPVSRRQWPVVKEFATG